MLKLRERLAWLILRSYSKHQVSGSFTFFLFFFLSFSTPFSQPSYLLLEILNAERRFLKFRDWKCFKGHLIILIFQFDRHVKFAIRGAIVWKIRMENHGKSYSSLFTIFSLFLSPFLFIVFIKRTFSLSYPWRRTKKFSRLGSKARQRGTVLQPFFCRRRKTSPFYLLDHCHWHPPIIIMFHEYIPLISFTSLRRDFPLPCFLVKREETSLHPTYLHE